MISNLPRIARHLHGILKIKLLNIYLNSEGRQTYEQINNVVFLYTVKKTCTGCWDCTEPRVAKPSEVEREQSGQAFCDGDA